MKIFSTILLLGLMVTGCSNSTAQKLQTESGQTITTQQIQSTDTTTAKTVAEQTSATTNADAKAASGKKEMKFETATFAGGCFWCTEAVFLALEGVDSVLPGYMGGHVENPTYEQVCKKKTGHAEVIQIKFDPKTISYDELLFVFFKTHDPTTLNRQGNDEGPQYRSAVFFHDEKQKESAETIMKKIGDSDLYENPIVTEITAASTMYVAEDYHINFYANNPGNGYCNAFIPDKIKKLKKLFGDKLKSQFKN